mgnify:FL=1
MPGKPLFPPRQELINVPEAGSGPEQGSTCSPRDELAQIAEPQAA